MSGSRLPAPGDRLGEYALERALGKGAMGAVFVGRHEGTGARHAIKVLLLGGGETRRERFAREARALAKVDRHPGVVRIHRYDVLPDGVAYLALDLIEGSDLRRRLTDHPGGLPVASALRLCAALARALAHCHAAGVAHRDLKPENVLLAGDQPVLTDFGVARDEAEERLTRTNEVVGTPYYMAPEQATGEREVGAPADVFALGVLLHEAIAGRPPFEAPTLLELFQQIVNGEPPRAGAARTDVPRDLERVALAALAKAPAARPTAAELAGALEAIERGERPALLARSSTLERTAQLLVRRRGPLAVALGGALLLVATGAGGLALARRREAAQAWEQRARGVLGEARRARLEVEAAALGWVRDGATRDASPALRALAAAGAPPPGAADDVVASLAAERAALERAVVVAEGDAALGRGDPLAARAVALRLDGPERALLEARAEVLGLAPGEAAARLDEAAAALPDPARSALLLLAARRALDAEDGARARGLLLRARAHEPAALAAARRAIDQRLRAHAAAEAAARHDLAATVEALRAVEALDPAAVAQALERAVAAAIAAAGTPARRERAGALVEGLLAALPTARHAPAGAALLLELALAANERGDWAGIPGRVDAAWRIDPAQAPPSAVASSLMVDGQQRLKEGQTAIGLALLLHAVRCGRPDPIPDDDQLRLLEAGAHERWVAQHPDDWAGWFMLADALNRQREVTPHALDGPLEARMVPLLERVLGGRAIPRHIRSEAVTMRIVALERSDPAGHLARIEAAWAEFPESWRVAELGCARTQGSEAAVVWGRRALEAVRHRIATPALLSETGDVFDGARRLRSAWERLIEALIGAGRPADALAATDEMAEDGVDGATVNLWRGRAHLALADPRAALAAARLALARQPDHAEALDLARDAEAALARQGQ